MEQRPRLCAMRRTGEREASNLCVWCYHKSGSGAPQYHDEKVHIYGWWCKRKDCCSLASRNADAPSRAERCDTIACRRRKRHSPFFLCVRWGKATDNRKSRFDVWKKKHWNPHAASKAAKRRRAHRNQKNWTVSTRFFYYASITWNGDPFLVPSEQRQTKHYCYSARFRFELQIALLPRFIASEARNSIGNRWEPCERSSIAELFRNIDAW